jgi:predicted nucleic acid-binding protein
LARIVLLDAGPLGLLVVPGEHGPGGEARRWVAELITSGVSVLLPDVVRYEVCRELKRRQATAKLARLKLAVQNIARAEHTIEAWDRAEDFWAMVRMNRLPTAPDDSLDGDCLLAGIAATVGSPGDEVVVATMNMAHLNRFPGIDAREWRNVRCAGL